MKTFLLLSLFSDYFSINTKNIFFLLKQNKKKIFSRLPRLEINFLRRTRHGREWILYPTGAIFLFHLCEKIFRFLSSQLNTQKSVKLKSRPGKKATESHRERTFCGRCSHTNEERIKIGEWFRPEKKRTAERSQKKEEKNRIKSWLNSSRMEIKTAEIVWGKKREKHQQKRRWGKNWVEVAVCYVCTDDGFPWGGMMMLNEKTRGESKKAHTIKIPKRKRAKHEEHFFFTLRPTLSAALFPALALFSCSFSAVATFSASPSGVACAILFLVNQSSPRLIVVAGVSRLREQAEH